MNETDKSKFPSQMRKINFISGLGVPGGAVSLGGGEGGITTLQLGL